MDAELNKLEEELKKLSPLGMPDDMISRLDSAMARWHEHVPVEEKIVPLNQDPAESTGNWLGWRSVAAVAVMGAGVAFISGGGNPPANPSVASSMSEARVGISTAAFTPSDARAKILSTNDVGVIWTKSGQAVRCMEVNATNTVYFQNEEGEQVIVEQPTREVVFLPAKID
jgi:hypothetical protein